MSDLGIVMAVIVGAFVCIVVGALAITRVIRTTVQETLAQIGTLAETSCKRRA